MRPHWMTAACFVLTTTAGACSTGYYSAPVRSNPVTGARWQDPVYFKSEAERRADWIQSQVRADVESGRVPPQALRDLDAQRRMLEASLDAARVDGVIDAEERRDVQSVLDRMGATSRRWGGPGYYGGGPRAVDAAGRQLYDHNWRRLY